MNGLVGWLGGAYVLVKALHVVVTFFWIAGLFMLPRYLVYQQAEAPGSPEDRRWTERTARLRRIILTPSLVLVWVLGLMTATSYGLASAGWLHAKITLVLLLSAYHGWMVARARRMGAGDRVVSDRSLRLLNEVPAPFVIGIVLLAVLKPF
ncbi:MAG: CopD family protein [Sphingomonadaceae bacterium]|uniref:CopD family protein n=1 Tax=Thermaurantiacus sp. TaxID=2820283 RepID=UPI00298EF6F0|nr:CopD family protein [Thermaurantiacus sp.]MCS6987655.1 CopD family protein [Sphingomonadaceae bacterium]MDW8415256.1 CopD family protein [Thermaurantiacus sp.]